MNILKEKRNTLNDYEKKKSVEEKKDMAYRMNNDAAKLNQLHSDHDAAKKES
jgi:hypothetical protein